MIKVSLYKTTQDKLSKAFCSLAEKCYHNNISIFVYTNNKESTKELDRILWTYSKKQFIPHATIHDNYPEKQPILLGDELVNLNNSSNMMIINTGREKIFSALSTPDQFDLTKCQRIILLFDDEHSFSKQEIEDILIKSPVRDFKVEAYIQNSDKSWIGQK